MAVSGLTDAVEVTAGGGHTCARRASGQVVCWGDNQSGQLGDGTTIERHTPVAVMGLADAVSISAGSRQHTCAVRSSGAVACWGDAEYGALGDGAATHSACTYAGYPSDCSRTPVTVSGLTDAVEVSLGFMHACARRTSGEVACWGWGDFGQLGTTAPPEACTDGTIGVGPHACALTPVAVSGLTDAIQISAGPQHECATRASGAVVCWGDNNQGQIGDGTTERRWTPVEVASLADAAEVATGQWHSCARRASGAVVCWGDNSLGQLSDGSLTHPTCSSLTPIAVVAPM